MPKKDYPPYRYFICPECDKEKEIPAKEFANHVESHGIAEKTGKRSLMLHINRKPRHTSSYEWIIGGKTFYEYIG